MIRLTLNGGSEPKIHLFNKSIIIIGTNDASCDISLVTHSPISLKLVEHNRQWFIINVINDPFICVNGVSFGKKQLETGDVIQIEQQDVLFENLQDFPIDDVSTTLKQENKDIKKSETFKLPFENEVEALKDEQWQSIESIDRYVEKISSKAASNSATKPVNSLKDDYLKDLEDRPNATTKLDSSDSNHLYQAWKWILLFIVCLLTISASIGLLIYYNASGKTESHVAKATQGTADIAMALVHAELSHHKPLNHNWTDVDFLKTHLKDLLSHTTSFASELDAQGQFNCCPYSLRVYTTSDLSRFLLIAQPTPSLLYWLIPKPIIVIDSNSMELRSLTNVRALNRLLAVPDPLEGANGEELAELISLGEMIPLNKLATEVKAQTFDPPQELLLLNGQAANYIYNAPRYFRLGQNLIQKSISLISSKSSSKEVAAFKEDIEAFNWLNHLILYALDKTTALQARQGLKIFAPSNKMYLGYLSFDPRGEIVHSQILEEDETNQTTHLADHSREDESIALNDFVPSHEDKDQIFDVDHPITIQLKSIIDARYQALKPLTDSMIKILQQQLEAPQIHFQLDFQAKENEYLLKNAKFNQELKETITLLYHQYDEMPAHQFLSFLKHFHLEELIQEEEEDCLSVIDENCHQNIETLLGHIARSKNLTELDNFTLMTGSWLNFDYVRDPKELVKYQMAMRNLVLKQLEMFLLTSEKELSYSPEEHIALQNILNQVRLVKVEEKDFFLNEYLLLLSNYQRTLMPSNE